MKLTVAPAQKISAPIIKESPINIECEIKEIYPCGSHDMFIAQVIAVGADGAYIDPKSGKFDFMKARPICFSHGAYYEIGKFAGKFGFSVQKKKKKA
jgi:flavin reductase (DIM6/NTAB) family NADH-FMN oxidoreductase RutF